MKLTSLHKAAAAIDTLTLEKGELQQRVAELEAEMATHKAAAKKAADDAQAMSDKIAQTHTDLSARLASFSNEIGAVLSGMKR